MWYPTHWDTVPYSNPRHNKLVIDLSNPKFGNFKNSREVVIDAVHQITNDLPPPYTLLVSGGIDSQAMLYAWKLAGVPHNIVHYSYFGLNDHDTTPLRQFTEREGIKVEYRDFEPLKFIQSPELIEYAKKYDTTSPQITSYMKFIENHPETVIMSGNTFGSQTVGLNYTILALDRFRKITKSNFVPFFFNYTPSITFLQDFVDYPVEVPGTNETYSVKINVYNSFGVNVIRQERAFSGFERIKELCDDIPVPLNLKYKYMYMASKRPFDVFYRYELYKYIGYYSELTRIIR